jgi:hypothetical protein
MIQRKKIADTGSDQWTTYTQRKVVCRKWKCFVPTPTLYDNNKVIIIIIIIFMD